MGQRVGLTYLPVTFGINAQVIAGRWLLMPGVSVAPDSLGGLSFTQPVLL